MELNSNMANQQNLISFVGAKLQNQNGKSIDYL